ncbi:MAG: methyl-accepting chemotaxis protein [Tissierella sp.]|uniref:methyl-accepting chemotaxis protein n=1 Tax=Tissierella sp. TaxID=41274 RepID=UPI003F97318E
MKLKNRIVIFTVLICIVSIVSMSVLNYTLSIKQLENEVNDKTKYGTMLVSKELDKWVGNQKKAMDEIIGGMVVGDNFEEEYAAEYLKVANDRNEGSNYYIGFKDGEFIHHSADLGSDPSERPWYIEAVAAEEFYISEPYVDQVLGDMIVTISRSFNTKEGREGVIAADIRIGYLTDYIREVSLGEGSYAFLVDADGDIIAHADDEFSPTTERVINIEEVADGELAKVISVEDKGIQDRKFKDYDDMEKLLFFEEMEEVEWGVGTAVAVKDTLGVVNNVIKLTILAAVIILAVGIAVSYIMANYISKPIVRATNIAENIGNLDLTDTIDSSILDRQDEIGVMALAFKNVIDKLRIFMFELDDSVETNEESFKKSNERLKYLLEQAEDTSATTEELSAGMEETAASAMTLDDSTREINDAISDFSNKMEEGANTSNAISDKADKLSTQFVHARDNTMEIYSKTKSEIETAVESAKEVEKIDVLSNAILEISEQTSLLSLNAAIEAARAGEAGRGFAVVAEEIRKLAENSNSTVGEIQDVTKGVTDVVNNLVESVGHLVEFLEANVIKDYEMIVGATEEYKEDGMSLNNMISDLSATSEELEATLNEVFNTINDISVTVEESTTATTNIAEKNQYIVETVNRINDIMETNREVSDKLTNIVSQVKLEEDGKSSSDEEKGSLTEA